jgi:Protein of unknown function (DUF3016)
MRATATAVLLILAGIGLAHAAGTVNVSFVEPDKFVDAGNKRSDTPATLKALEQHFHALGQRYLADGQTLTVEVLDVDLAGSVRFGPGTGTEVRVYKGSADWPRIKLRYTLEAPGQEPRRGEELLKSLSYQQKTARYSDSDPFRYEKQMLDQWFKARFAPKQP